MEKRKTGFYDEKGVEILEGDIVSFLDFYNTECGYCEQYCIGKVIYNEETKSFEVTDRLYAESYEILDRGCLILERKVK